MMYTSTNPLFLNTEGYVLIVYILLFFIIKYIVGIHEL